MPNQYILLDFENTQPEDLTPLKGTVYKLRVFLGSQQTKVPSTLAIQMQQLGGNADYIQIEGRGRNALDFHIAYYMGKLAAEDPGSRVQVISRDTGFAVHAPFTIFHTPLAIADQGEAAASAPGHPRRERRRSMTTRPPIRRPGKRSIIGGILT